MKHDYTDLALDKDGIPILTDLVPDEEQETAAQGTAVPPPPPPSPVVSPADIARELLESETVRQQLDEMAGNLASDMRLQMEQTLAEAIDKAIDSALERYSSNAREHIREQLTGALPWLIARALQDTDLQG